jgi:archaellum biogenesis protein FlaJ (TadC family)
MRNINPLHVLLAVAFALAITPDYNQAIQNAASSWPANSPVTSSVLNIIPSPVGLVFSFIMGTFIVWLLAKGLQST